MTDIFKRSLFPICSLVFIPAILYASDMEITPFRTTNQSPLVVIHGLPADSSSTIAPKGHFSSAFTFDLASNYTTKSLPNESILLDGESYRWTLSTRYGVTDRVEIGLDLPYMIYGGGFLDSFIIDWHNTFGLPQGGRTLAPKNRLRYSYSKNGNTKLLIDRSGNGLGDLTLTTGLKLSDSGSSSEKDSLAIRATVKLPTGDSDRLLGDGAFSGTVSLCGGINSFTEWGTLGLFGSAGALLSGGGKVLTEQQRNLAGFGTAGLGWGPLPWISFKVQLNGNTPLYGDSNLTELSKPSVMLVSGGALKFPGDYILDIGVSEDVAVATAPDVSFHLGLSRQF